MNPYSMFVDRDDGDGGVSVGYPRARGKGWQLAGAGTLSPSHKEDSLEAVSEVVIF